ncbi:hypothetical protein [Marivirga harenae]|uniref:hypothetical protein n=1 Tax=Marivirga harenae TaxID=2010992 RepID=UPI0026DECBD6|nr:hypothetical protein [Marivirga harenae]WKV12413.1 hypothetical protein Q3Y49_01000 [Marivirga harenae]|tara:strand:+ start:205 stop:438 length:234 start_codon:yes stop_codon:yes gene_type:complete
MKKYLSNNLHTTGKYFQKRKEKKRKEKAFLSGGIASGASLFWKILPLVSGGDFSKKPKGLDLRPKKQFIPNLLSSFI